MDELLTHHIFYICLCTYRFIFELGAEGGFTILLCTYRFICELGADLPRRISEVIENTFKMERDFFHTQIIPKV